MSECVLYAHEYMSYTFPMHIYEEAKGTCQEYYYIKCYLIALRQGLLLKQKFKVSIRLDEEQIPSTSLFCLLL